MRTCTECDFGVAIEGDEEGLLECRRHPPRVGIYEDGTIVTAFPICDPYLWCGDFEQSFDVTLSIGRDDG